jgi:hypothetical protein
MKKLVYQTPQVLDLSGPGASGQSPLGACGTGFDPLAPGNPCRAGVSAGEECNAGYNPGISPPEYCNLGGAPETAPCYVGSFPSSCTGGGAPGIGSCAIGTAAV